MESISLPEQIAGGMDQRYFPSSNAAQLVENYRYEPSGGWRNDRGWEPLIPYPSPFTLTNAALTDLLQPCRFLQVIQRHTGAEEYYLQERNGNLFYEFGNQGTSVSNKVILDKDRNLPRSDDPGTQAIPYGRFTAIVNGYDKALVILPHDGETQDKVYDVSYASALREAGFEVVVIPNQGAGAAMMRVESARRLFPSVWFNEATTTAGLDALGWYHEKRDEARNIGLGPDHDWSSHGADAYGLMCVAYEEPEVAKKAAKPPRPKSFWAS